MKSKIFIYSIILLFTSCKSVLKTFYGIKKPKIETENTLRKYLKKKDINDDNIYTVNYSDFKKINKQIDGIPEILIFENNGKLIKYKNDNECNAKAFDFIENLSKTDSLRYDKKTTLNNYLNKLRDFNGKAIKMEKDNNIDFYLFVFWAKYVGRLNKDHVKIWEEQANNNKRSKIKVVKVNLDIQKWWEKLE